MRRKEHPWYSFDRLLTFGAMMNFCAGGRGMGKTFDAKKRSIRKAIKTGEQFIYLRRYKEETSIASRTFFADVGLKFPDWDFRVSGKEAQMSPVSTRDEKKRYWQTIGFFVSLSQAQNWKSASMHNVTTIIFDEFIAEKGRQYLQDEANTFLGFYSTVDRNQDKTRVLFCANSVTIMNPYFLEFNIRPDQLPEYSAHRRDDTGMPYIAVHLPEAADFKNSVYETRFGKFIQGTEFGDYAVENNFDDAHDSLVDIKPSTAKHQYNLETKRGNMSVWYDRASGEYYIQKRLPKDSPLNLTLLPEKMAEGKTLVTFNDKLMQYLRASFNNGRVTFDSPTTRNAFAEISKR